MSLQTTLANAAADDAAGIWRRHRRNCAQCNMAVYRRKPGEMCGQGAAARGIATELAGQAKREAEADKAPNPNQASLF